jgi:hypothetical protein
MPGYKDSAARGASIPSLADILSGLRQKKANEARAQQPQRGAGVSQKMQQLRARGMSQFDAVRALAQSGDIDPRTAQMMLRVPRAAQDASQGPDTREELERLTR